MSQPMTPCVRCALSIPLGAKVCTHCDAAQAQLERCVKRVSAVLIGVIALAPIGDAAWSLRQIASGKHHADVRLRVLNCAAGGIALAAMNFGKGPAFLGAPTFSVSGVPYGDTSSLTLRADTPVYVLAPAAVTIMKFVGWIGHASVDLPRQASQSACAYHTTVTVDDAYESKTLGVECPCPSV